MRAVAAGCSSDAVFRCQYCRNLLLPPSEVTTLSRHTNMFIYYDYYYYCYYHKHKAASRKTRLDVQNYGCNDNLFSDHDFVETNCISSLQSHGKALEKECYYCYKLIIVIITIIV